MVRLHNPNPNCMPPSPQLTLHTVFPPEVDRSSLQLTSRVIWPDEVLSIQTTQSHRSNTHTAELKSDRMPIPKPKGVVGRIKEGGYSLFAVLGWEKEQYKEVQVGLLNANRTRHMMTDSTQAFVRRQALLHCDVQLNYTSQRADAVFRVCQSVRL
jgi:hypothetical protein